MTLAIIIIKSLPYFTDKRSKLYTKCKLQVSNGVGTKVQGMALKIATGVTYNATLEAFRTLYLCLLHK